MKNQNRTSLSGKYIYIFISFLLLLSIISCSSSNSDGDSLPTASSFSKVKTKAVTSLKQHFRFNTADEYAEFTSQKGVVINISAISLLLNGSPVTGKVNIEYAEIFDGGTMAATGKHTMGKMPDGKRAMLISGGEFYINITKNGQQLDLDGSITLEIPTNLTDGTNGGNPEMTLWDLAENDSVWVPIRNYIPWGTNGVVLGQESVNGSPLYYAYVTNFGWTNADCFYNDPREKTTILASVPSGYNAENCSIFLHYDGQGSALALFDRYSTETGLFSEHYGQIPIGLQCHIIFVTESNGKYRYAVKPATITAGAVYNFTIEETIVGSQAQLTAAINALP